MHHMTLWFALLLWQQTAQFSISTNISETCSLASYYSSHMVLQQQPHSAILWGYADINATVVVSVQKMIYKAQALPKSFSDVGVWLVKLDPVAAGGPYTISINCTSSTNSSTTTLEDVMFGDVWVCSGQSNMAFTVNQSFNGEAELNASTNYPDVRVLAVKQVLSGVPLYDLHGLYEPWSKPTPETLGGEAAIFTYFSALCWFFGRDLYDSLQYPIGLISTNWGGTPIEDWSSPDVLRACNSTDRKPPKEQALNGAEFGPIVNSGLWNSMIHPLLNMTIKGAIWYQGESNAGNPNAYKCLFHAMIDDWRSKWNSGTQGSTDPVFPFGFMQLCTSNNPNPDVIGPYPLLRWHQTYDYGYVPNPVMNNVFMAVTVDLVDLTSPAGPIHPRDKQDMGIRLSLACRWLVYGQNVQHAGPFPTAMTVDNKTLTILVEYDRGKANVKLVGQVGFEICCTSQPGASCVWVPAEIIGQPTVSTLTLSYYCSNMQPTSVRYLWRDMPCTFKNCPVYSTNNSLPGAPFNYTL